MGTAGAQSPLGNQPDQSTRHAGMSNMAKRAGIGGAEYVAMEGGRMDHQNTRKLWGVAATIEAALSLCFPTNAITHPHPK